MDERSYRNDENHPDGGKICGFPASGPRYSTAGPGVLFIKCLNHSNPHTVVPFFVYETELMPPRGRPAGVAAVHHNRGMEG